MLKLVGNVNEISQALIKFIYFFDMERNNRKQISGLSHLQYRLDINGIRGIAILLVVISHGWWENLPSGKVGVDIFFVISGYLISGIIFRERAKGEYTIWKFYARRIRRLAPALIFFLGYMLYLIPYTFFHTNRQRMRQEGSHIMASILMAENLEHIRMDFNNQYNSTVTTHLWSLGIQQQFYIFWPLVTGLIMKLNLKWGSFAIICLICASLKYQFYLEVAYYAWRTCSFVPFARFWQFLVGCLLAFVQFKMKQAEAPQVNLEQIQMIQQNDIISETKQVSIISLANEDIEENRQANSQQKSMGSERIMENNHIVNHNLNYNQKINKNYKKKENNQEDYTSIKYLLILIREVAPFICFYVIYTSARTRTYYPQINNRNPQHVGFLYLKPILATAVLIMTKDSFFNRRILGAKILQFCGDVSYPLYLWHAGLQMSYNFNNVIVQIYVPALIYSCISMEFIEPFFRRNQQKWVIPFLICAQLYILWSGYQLYSANL